MTRCPKCGRFLANLRAEMTWDDIRNVRGDCKVHGAIEPDDWDADMFEREEASGK